MLPQIAEAWARRTPREQGLAMVVVGLVAAMTVLLGVRGALSTIDRLDRDIDRLQSDIVNYSHQIARRQAVEARFAQVAQQHSSAWSESEIRDRLRQEIYRLGNAVPPPLDEKGIPVSTGGNEELLVSIPELRGGQLEAGGEGFREYRLDFTVLPAPFLDMVTYLERLLQSPQSLRIDRIDMRRDPGRPEVSAEIAITRIVVDDAVVHDAVEREVGDTAADQPKPKALPQTRPAGDGGTAHGT